ncbi:MAG: hypothetical protein FI718_00065, partial [SAR202 cluster bacterium]|nr:hypothetical protein [SAR202 cluster bacterium]
SHIVTITFLATVMVILIIECYTFSGLNVNFSHISFEGLAKLSKYSFPIIGSSLCFALMFQGDVIFLAYFHSPFETGNYYAAKRLVLPIMIIPALSKGLMIPIVAGRKVPQNIILKFILFVLGITFFITVGLILLGPWLMVFLYGDAYNSSRLLLALLGLSAFFISIKNVIVTELLGTGQSLKVFWTDFIPLPIVLFLYFYLVPDIHGEGAAYSIFTGSFISLIVSLRFIYKSKTFS